MLKKSPPTKQPKSNQRKTSKNTKKRYEDILISLEKIHINYLQKYGKLAEEREILVRNFIKKLEEKKLKSLRKQI